MIKHIIRFYSTPTRIYNYSTPTRIYNYSKKEKIKLIKHNKTIIKKKNSYNYMYNAIKIKNKTSCN